MTGTSPLPGSTPVGSEIVHVTYRVRVPGEVVQAVSARVVAEMGYLVDEDRAEIVDDLICKWVEDRLPTVLTDHAEGHPDVEI